MAGRILHVSDIHFGVENRDAINAVADLAHGERFDLIAVTGDITQFGRNDEFDAARAWLEALPRPWLLTPGNHDVPYATPGRLFQPFARYERRFGPAEGDGVKSDTLTARTMNTSRGVQLRTNWSKGALRAEDAEAVGQYMMSGAPGSLKVALCHHPLIEVTGGPMTGKVRGGAKGLAILAGYKTEVVLTGHVHTAFAHEQPPFGIYAIGASTLSTRERGQPAGFNLIGWDEDSIEVRAQGWTGSEFETIRTWALPRHPPRRI